MLHRDILHALIMPIVTLFQRASALAEAALCTRKTEDLELAFAGDARGFPVPAVHLDRRRGVVQRLGMSGYDAMTLLYEGIRD
jgi:hypothetical protein